MPPPPRWNGCSQKTHGATGAGGAAETLGPCVLVVGATVRSRCRKQRGGSSEPSRWNSRTAQPLHVRASPQRRERRAPKRYVWVHVHGSVSHRSQKGGRQPWVPLQRNGQAHGGECIQWNVNQLQKKKKKEIRQYATTGMTLRTMYKGACILLYAKTAVAPRQEEKSLCTTEQVACCYFEERPR